MSIQAPQATEGNGTGTGTRRNAAPAQSFFSGRSELVVPALMLALALFLTWQTATMEVLGKSVPGPQFFPTIVCVLLYGVVIAHTIQIFRSPRGGAAAPAAEEKQYKTQSDWKTMGMVVAGVIGFILILPYAGWILSAAALFWVVARALGSKKALFDVSIALLFSCVIQLAFNAGLGLNLPAGFLEGLL